MANFRGLIRNCAVCGAEYRTPPSLERVKTCSRACGYAARRVANKVDPVRLQCAHCAKPFTEPPSRAPARRFCSNECRFASPAYKAEQAKRVSGQANPLWKGSTRLATSASGRQYRRMAPEREAERSVARRLKVDRATPAWADRASILAVYREARRLTRETGIPHHVDHIVPINGRRVSGLHVHTNLRAIPAPDNLRKGAQY